MNRKIYPTLIIISLLSLVSCKTASKMYEKGNYDEAVELAAKKLQKDPDDPKLLNIIQEAYRFAFNDHQDKIRNHNQGNSQLKWEWIYYDYAALQKMYEAIYKVPAVFNIIKPENYSSYMITYGEKAAEARMDRGLEFMNRGDKQSFRNAYREFKMASVFKPGDLVIINRMNEAYEYAVTNVVVLPIQQYGGYVYSTYIPGGNNLDDEILRGLRFNSTDEFLKFYSAWDARAKNIRRDMIVDMQMTTLNLGMTRDRHSSRKVSREVVVKETVIRPDSVVKEYARVHAEITTTRRSMNSNAVLHVSVKDADGRWLWNDNFNAVHAWATEFSTYTGDSRALSTSDKAELDRRPEREPGQHEVMICLIEEIKRTAETGLRNYFTRY